jgi:hypothetical protein
MFVRIIELESVYYSRVCNFGLQRLDRQVVGRMLNIEKSGSHCDEFENSKEVEDAMLRRGSGQPMALFMIFAQSLNMDVQGGLAIRS